MPAERLSMRKIREVLRLRALGLSKREIAQSISIGATTVLDYQRRADRAGVSWPLPEDWDDARLERELFEDAEPPVASAQRPLPDWAWVHAELKRKHVTLMLLWQEYKAEHPAEGLQYSQFCERYRQWAKTLKVWMRQEHRAGEKLFADYSGDGIPWVDTQTGEVHTAQLFVAVLGASNYTFARATRTQKLRDWLDAQVHALEYFGGAPHAIVPDQPRSIVDQPCRYEPKIDPAYQEFARHYGTCVIPARPGKPRDKAKVEAGVLIAQRWIIAALRNRRFHSIDEINEAIAELLERFNDRTMQRLKKSRRQLFEEIEQEELNPLPQRRYEFAEWKIGARVNMDYHVVFDGNYYSVPFTYARQQVDFRATSTTVEIFCRHTRIASHLRCYKKHVHVTLAEHMPRAHRKHLEWSPSRLLKWAEKVGPSTAELVERILSERPHPEQGYRACLGILRLAKHYGDERLEKASRRALVCRSHSYRFVESTLKNQLEDRPLPQASPTIVPVHENVRGSAYYN